MKLLFTHPGRHGDLLWALPTMKALKAHYANAETTLLVSAKYGSEGFLELLRAQPYLDTVLRATDWAIEESAPITPRVPPLTSSAMPRIMDRVFSLGYQGWPTAPLPQYTALLAHRQITEQGDVPNGFGIDLQQPWITNPVPPPGQGRAAVVVGFTDEHFELKVGLTAILADRHTEGITAICAPGSRWAQEAPRLEEDAAAFLTFPCSWKAAAWEIAEADVFFGCCSALHVLAVGLGKPCVIMEPSRDRWHEIFWPLGKFDRVRLVLGSDGQPTFDARHCAQILKEALRVAAR